MATRYKGYTGKVLHVDLTTGNIGEYPVSDRDRELFLGGRYLSTKILWDILAPGTDPLDPENPLIVMTSPLTGTGAPSTSRYDISAKSPLTGIIGHSNSGGNFGIFLKRAGWDGVIVRGRSDRPVYLDIEGREVKIIDASKIWGLDTQQAQVRLSGGSSQAGTMVIGPAGENLVKYASVVSQERSHGRTGMGAVMGSKNLKGMIARGKEKTELHDPAGFKDTVKKWVRLLQEHPATGDTAPRYGTAYFLTSLSVRNALPTKNFSEGSYRDAHLIGGESLAEKYLVKNSGCLSCPIRCARVVNIDGHEVKGPEYEILCLLGSNMLINDLEAIIRWNYELDLMGIDAISAGTVIGFAAELNEKGLWRSGIEFGKKDNISDIIRMIAAREGIGDDLAEGVRYLSKKYGGEGFAPHSKGLEFPAYEPRASIGHGLGYATASRGACHLDGGYLIYLEVSGPVNLDQFNYRAKPAWVALDQDLLAVISAGGNCLFTSWTFVPKIAYSVPGKRMLSSIISKIMTHSTVIIKALYRMPAWLKRFHLPLLPHSRALSKATGMKIYFGQMMEIGARGYTMEKLFNLREGVGRYADTLPSRFTTQRLIEKNPRSIVPVDKMIRPYYALRGWDINGIPTERTLRKLGLDFVTRER